MWKKGFFQLVHMIIVIVYLKRLTNLFELKGFV